MTEIKYLLDQAVPARHPAVVDPAGDLARGRARLNRTRRTRLALLGGAAAVAIAVPLGVSLAPSDPVGRPVPTTAAPALPAVDLVAYTGRQVPGYRVAEVPAGWEIQGGNAFALVLAPKGFADQDTDSFLGKIVVMLASKDQQGLGDGNPITVDGRPGVWSTQGDTQVLLFESAGGRNVDVQVPTGLRWDAEHLARFGAGVEVLSHAEAGNG